jgi:hypothetical protein
LGSDLVRAGEERFDKYYAPPPCGTKVMLTTHEDLVASGDDMLIFNILDFYNIPRCYFSPPPPPEKTMAGSHFRSGRVDSWQTELSTEQQRQVTDLMPPEWRRYFGWADAD